MNRIILAVFGLCAVEALVSTPLTFTSGTLLWARQSDSRLFDVTGGGDLSQAPLVAWGTGHQNGQLAFTQDLTAAYMTGAQSRRVLKITPDSTTAALQATLPAAAYGIVVTPEGMIYASSADGKVYDVTSGSPVVVASGLSIPRNMLWTPGGILVVEQGANRVTKLGNIGGNNGPAQTFATGVVGGSDIEMFNGRIYVTSFDTSQVYDVTSGGAMTSANIFATGQSFIGITSANNKLYATNFDETSPKIFDITSGGIITNANVFGYNLPGAGDTIFDAVPGSSIPDDPVATPEASSLFMFATGAVLLAFRRRTK